MPRYRLTIAYDGTAFHGWQRQEPKDAPPLRTVQGVVQDAVADLLGERVDVVGASRTDSGVHAVGQVAAFTANVRVPIHRLAAAITARLPADVQVSDAAETHDAFNPIGDARSKCYRYTIEHTSHPHHPRPLFDRNLVFATPYTLDVGHMREAAAGLVGTHDCVSFAQINHGRATTVRTIFDCSVRTPSARRVEIEITANGFLYNMVRIIAGTLVEVGRGRMTADSMRHVIAARDRRSAGPTLPPHGLCLRWIWYGGPHHSALVGDGGEAQNAVSSDEQRGEMTP
ncbi:MAG: tRNA pseudouridine(38-40) synthase TruA [Limnohabitans sp.]|nr:tRNA pseudouridine(38-40) synthase TruA [Limnohabitans sp.]